MTARNQERNQEWIVARVPASLRAKVERVAQAHGLSVSEVVRLALATFLVVEEEAEDDSDAK